MEFAGAGEPVVGRSHVLSASPLVNDRETRFLADSNPDDARSSSLSDIDERLDHDQIDHVSPKPGKFACEIDSEAETERIDESPNSNRDRKNIVLSTGTYEPGPSKLAQLTTYDELDEDDGQEADNSPSKPPRSPKSNGILAGPEEITPLKGSDKFPAPQEVIGKKRKRLDLAEDAAIDPAEDEPLRKRRGSLPLGGSLDTMPDQPQPIGNADPLPKNYEGSNDETPATDEILDNDSRPAILKGKKGKKGKRKGKRARDPYDDTERGSVPLTSGVEHDSNDVADEQPGDEEENPEGVDDADDTEAVSKIEEYMRKTTAMDSLVSLERQFATLRDRIYDERIANLNNELAQLEATPTHSEYLRQLRIVEQYRDDKIKHETILFAYKFKALSVKSMAERSQINSSYFQRARDVREHHLDNISELHYRVQQDRYQKIEASSDYHVPFPMRRSQQIAQQTAYNKEVSLLSGLARFVGFPAAPIMRAARKHESDEDFEKMGISTQLTTTPAQLQTPFSRGAFASTSSAARRPGAEEEFLEKTPWANPQHPIHEQYMQQLQQGKLSDQQRATHSFGTPATQQRIGDLTIPNGSASTIPENPSGPNSSTANTPYGMEQDRAVLSHGQSVGPTESSLNRHTEADEVGRNTGYRSLISSPSDTRKPNPRAPPSKVLSDRRSPMLSASESTTILGTVREHAYSTPSSSTRLGLFGTTSRRESSPQLPGSNPDMVSPLSRQRPPTLTSMHQAAVITAGGSGRSRMGAR